MTGIEAVIRVEQVRRQREYGSDPEEGRKKQDRAIHEPGAVHGMEHLKAQDQQSPEIHEHRCDQGLLEQKHFIRRLTEDQKQQHDGRSHTKGPENRQLPVGEDALQHPARPAVALVPGVPFDLF